MKAILYALAAIAVTGTLATGLRADSAQSGRAGLVGSWVENGGNRAWVIADSPDGLHMTEKDGSSPVADFQCATDGQDCKVKISGHKVSVSMYYNGDALVELETRGDQVVKRKFSVSGDSMKIEVTPMTGKLETEVRNFERGQSPAAK